MFSLEDLKEFFNLVFVTSAIIFCTLVKTLQRVGILLYKWFQYGNSFWVVRNRKEAPLCLNDETLGRHDFANLKKIRLHYVENGDRSKPLMLFVHGFPHFWYSWKHQLKHFSKTHWVVAMDMRGYGKSDRPTKLSEYRMEYLQQDVYDFIKHLGKSQCILVAHDWGAPICYYLASRHPLIIDKLIILNGGHPKVFQETLLKQTTNQIWKSWYMFFFQIPYIPELVIYYGGDLLVIDEMCNIYNNYFVDKRDMEAFKYAFSEKESWTAGINYYRCALWKNGKINPDETMANINVPTCIIWGDEDEYLGKDFPERTKQFIDNLVIHHIPGGHHFIQWQKPVNVNRLIEQFINNSHVKYG